MRGSILLLAGGLVATPALAQGITVKPLIDARLRYEHVDQDPLPRDADAITARVRAGVEARVSDVALLVEGEATVALDERYNSGVNGLTAYPIVADPETIELNRAQIQYRGLAKTVVTVGRQRINIDDQRFVGSVGFRANEQTFDAVRVEWSGVKAVKADITYAWSDRSIWGRDGGNGFGPARYRAIGGDNVFATLAWTTPLGTLTGYAYLVDQDEPLVRRNSSQSYGVRFAGARAVGGPVKFAYAVAYARQSDYARNPNRYAASYALADFAVEVKALRIGVGYELLGADSGVALTSFQTPLATLHKFNGWADKFLATPANGLRDRYASVGYGWKKVGPFDAISLSAAYHRYDSDRLEQHYGDEVNVQAMVRHGNYTALVKYAGYDADRFATDTRKLWLSLEWAL